MRALRTGGSCLVLIPLLVSFGCGNSAYVKKGPEIYTNAVKISNCKADPDTAVVHKGDTLTWTIDSLDSHTYSVNFPNRKPFSSSTIPPGQGQNVTGDLWCNTLGGISSGLCVYSYDLIQNPDPQNHGTKCPDPGVHVH
jgi:hypothetical protein